MAEIIVRQDGTGDHTSLAAALTAALSGDTISVEGAWSSPETISYTITKGVTIQTSGAARHDGFSGYTNSASSTDTHFCAKSTGGHVFTINTTEAVVFDGLDIFQAGTGVSDECIRIEANGSNVTIKNCILHGHMNSSGQGVSQQDGVYSGNVSCDVTVENVIVYNFGRACFHPQNYSDGTGQTQNWRFNCVTLFNFGLTEGSAGEGGGIFARRENATINIYANNVIGGKGPHTDTDAIAFDGVPGVNAYIDSSFFDDGYTFGMAGGKDYAVGYSITDNTAPGNATSLIVRAAEAVDGYFTPYDLRLANDADSAALAVHSNATGAYSGLIMPATDIAGNPRIAPYDVGASRASGGGTLVETLSANAVGFDQQALLDTVHEPTGIVDNLAANTVAFAQQAMGEVVRLPDTTIWALSTPVLAGTSTNDALSAQRDAQHIASVRVGGVIYQATAYHADPTRHGVIAIRNDQGNGNWTAWVEHVYDSNGPNDLGDLGLNDSHHYLSLGFSPDGLLHFGYVHHNDPLHYRQSVVPVHQGWDGTLTGGLPMAGLSEAKVSYLWYFNDRLGNLYSCYRSGPDASSAGAGNANTYIQKYIVGSGWTAFDELTGALLIDGMASNVSAYLAVMPTFDSRGRLHVAWNWRDTTGNDNHDMCAVRWSPIDGWQRYDGTAQPLPITQANAEIAYPSANNVGHKEANALCVDADDNPHLAFIKNGPSGYTQVHHGWHDGTSWQPLTQITNTTHPAYWTRQSNSARYLGGPALAGFTDGTVGLYFTDADNNNYLEEWFATAPYTAWARNSFVIEQNGGAYEPLIDRQMPRFNGELHFAFFPWNDSDPASGWQASVVGHQSSLTAIGAGLTISEALTENTVQLVQQQLGETVTVRETFAENAVALAQTPLADTLAIVDQLSPNALTLAQNALSDTISIVDALSANGVAFAQLALGDQVIQPVDPSDTFDGSTLDPKWTFVPGASANAAYVVSGGAISITGTGNIYDAVMDVARIEQPVLNGDFTIHWRIGIRPAVSYQDIGLIVFEDQANWIRFDQYGGSGTRRAFIGSTVNDSTTTHYNDPAVHTLQAYEFRVTRAGSAFTFEALDNFGVWRQLGTDLSRSMTVTKIGLYVGDASGADFTNTFEFVSVHVGERVSDTLSANTIAFAQQPLAEIVEGPVFDNLAVNAVHLVQQPLTDREAVRETLAANEVRFDQAALTDSQTTTHLYDLLTINRIVLAQQPLQDRMIVGDSLGINAISLAQQPLQDRHIYTITDSLPANVIELVQQALAEREGSFLSENAIAFVQQALQDQVITRESLSANGVAFGQQQLQEREEILAMLGVNAIQLAQLPLADRIVIGDSFFEHLRETTVLGGKLRKTVRI